MSEYAGRDETRGQRLAWWATRLAGLTLNQLTDDEVFFALEELAARHGRYWAGLDADGQPIYKAKRKPLAPATVNRYAAALGAVLSWAIRRRIAPKGWDNPCRRIERRPEKNEIIRFLSDEERTNLLVHCRRSKWDRLYLLVMLAITTGARRGELEQLRWRDVDLEQATAYVLKTKNTDRKVLPLVPTVIDELRSRVGEQDALIFGSARRPDVPYNHVQVWQSALKSSGIKCFRFHDLRHTCASYLAQSGATLLEIGEVLGHRQLSVTKRYSHLTVKNKAQLINRVLGGIQ
ncbi:MAG: site-specific integrase [Gammaproteobacteria bacterium]|nr:site-specific integrase [Gammaproteobacteria bacterium]MBU1441449.1 site-specific integrase [Gammaproteobacteria bacterium]MBU2285561.1 site-specific integrase [Gammaproteobacteria bacterium]